MQTIKLTNTAFNGVTGYHVTTDETIVSLIAKGLIDTWNIIKTEEMLSYGWTVVLGQYELKAA